MQNAPVGALTLHKTYASDQTTVVESLIDRLNLDALAGSRGVDHASTADIDADMAAIGSYHQVARSRIRNRHAHGTLSIGCAGQANAEVGKHVLGKSRAIKACGRICSSPYIGNPLELKGIVDHICTRAGGRHVSDSTRGTATSSRTTDLRGLALAGRRLGLLSSGLGILLGLGLGGRDVQ